eukprot:766813-Hanusia_phi.AAC.6
MPNTPPMFPKPLNVAELYLYYELVNSAGREKAIGWIKSVKQAELRSRNSSSLQTSSASSSFSSRSSSSCSQHHAAVSTQLCTIDSRKTLNDDFFADQDKCGCLEDVLLASPNQTKRSSWNTRIIGSGSHLI